MTVGTRDRLPKSIEAERLTLGSIVAFPRCGPTVFRKLRPADFVDVVHQKLYRAMLAQHARGMSVDPPLLAAELKSDPVFDGNPAAVVLDLGQSVATDAHVDHYANQVDEAARKRRLLGIGETLVEGSMNGKSSGELLNAALADIDDLQREREDVPREKFIFRDLRREFTRLNPPIVDGLFRSGETVNIISVSKVGKSWLGYNLALCIITGRPWLDRFPTSQGRVLIIDNELHKCTLAHRIPEVADALGIPPEHYEDDLEIWSLRGNLRSLFELTNEIKAIEPGEFKLILLDAKYRFAAPGKSENDNAAETQQYNEIDQWGIHTNSAIGLIHHSSKGNQSDKRTTDVGSGAGAQSRAADCHIVLREHEDPGVVVLDAAVRSFAPVEPVALRWQFPLWVPDQGVDTARLKRQPTGNEQRQAERDKSGIDAILGALLKGGKFTARQLRTKTGLSRERQDRLLNKLVADGDIVSTEIEIKGNKTNEYAIPESAQ